MSHHSILHRLRSGLFLTEILLQICWCVSVEYRRVNGQLSDYKVPWALYYKFSDTQVIFLLSGFTYLNISNQEKQSHQARY